jgi:hypothetical protein
MTFLLNLLPKIKAAAKMLIVVGNFILEVYHTVSTVITSTRSQFNNAKAA